MFKRIIAVVFVSPTFLCYAEQSGWEFLLQNDQGLSYYDVANTHRFGDVMETTLLTNYREPLEGGIRSIDTTVHINCKTAEIEFLMMFHYSVDFATGDVLDSSPMPEELEALTKKMSRDGATYTAICTNYKLRYDNGDGTGRRWE